MEAALDNAGRLFVLAIPAFVGFVCGIARLFRDPAAAVTVLNRYLLMVAFPALVAGGLLEASSAVPHAPVFWILWPVTLTVVLLVTRLTRPSPGARRVRAATGLVASFGNVAYVGLPFALATLGSGIATSAMFLVALHITAAVMVGPWLLARVADGARESSWRAQVTRVAKLPLFWAPFAGLLGRSSPIRAELTTAVGPIAGGAATIALFVLGLHLYVERERLQRVTFDVLAFVGTRMILSPVVMLALAWGAVRLGWLDPQLAVLHVVFASMPVGIATFSIAHDAGVMVDRVASSVVLSTVLALIALPLWTALASVVLAS